MTKTAIFEKEIIYIHSKFSIFKACGIHVLTRCVELCKEKNFCLFGSISYNLGSTRQAFFFFIVAWFAPRSLPRTEWSVSAHAVHADPAMIPRLKETKSGSDSCLKYDTNLYSPNHFLACWGHRDKSFSERKLHQRTGYAKAVLNICYTLFFYSHPQQQYYWCSISSLWQRGVQTVCL